MIYSFDKTFVPFFFFLFKDFKQIYCYFLHIINSVHIHIFVLKSGETALDIAMKQDHKSRVTELLKKQMMQVLQVLIFATNAYGCIADCKLDRASYCVLLWPL